MTTSQIQQLNAIYSELVGVESQVYNIFKDSDENTSVHLTMLQQDIDSALRVLEDLLGKE